MALGYECKCLNFEHHHEALHGHSILMRLDNLRFGNNKFKPHRHAEHTT